MTFPDYLRYVRSRLIRSHAATLPFFSLPQEDLHHRPASGGWTVAEILEHVSLTSHYLLIIIDKASAKALRKASDVDLEVLLRETTFTAHRIDRIGQHKAFPWIRPEHMEPTGQTTLTEVEDRLNQQLLRCLQIIDNLSEGEGLLQTTTMTVDGLGRLNVYEYVDFLAQHVGRHLTQIRINLQELENIN